MSDKPLTHKDVYKIIADEIAKVDPRVREQARESALAAVFEAGTLEKVANTPVFRYAVREGAAAYVRSGSLIAFAIAIVAAIPMVVPYCSSHQSLTQTKASAESAMKQAEVAAHEAKEAAKLAGDSSAASNETVKVAEAAVIEAKSKADAAISAAQTALDDTLKTAPMATREFVTAINTGGPATVESATRLLEGVQSLIKLNDPERGALQVADVLVCWGKKVVEPRSVRSPERQFVCKFAQRFDGDPVVVCSVMNDGGEQGFAVTNWNLGATEFNGYITEMRARPPLSTNQTVTVSYVAIGKAKATPVAPAAPGASASN